MKKNAYESELSLFVIRKSYLSTLGHKKKFCFLKSTGWKLFYHSPACIVECVSWYAFLISRKTKTQTKQKKQQSKATATNRQTKKQKTNKTRKQKQKKRKKKQRRKDNISVENLTRYDYPVMFVNLLCVRLSYYSSREFFLVVNMNLIEFMCNERNHGIFYTIILQQHMKYTLSRTKIKENN